MIILQHKNVVKIDEAHIDSDGFGRVRRIDKENRFEDCTEPVLTMYGFVNPPEIVDSVQAAKDYIQSLDKSLSDIVGDCNIIYTGRCRTFQTDGWDIFINPGFVKVMHNKVGDELADVSIAYLIAHEALHIIFDHVKQYKLKGYTDHDRANKAMDCEVNWFIEHYITEGDGEYIFKDLHDKMGLWWDERAEQMLWEELYKVIDVHKYDVYNITKTSAAWKRGFVDGYNSECSDLRKLGLIK